MILLAFLSFFVLSCTADPVDQAKCYALTEPRFWLQGYCFVITNESYNSFDRARTACTQFDDGHLAYVTNDAESTAVFNMGISKVGKWYNLWIGLKQVDTSVEPAGGWQWQEGPLHGLYANKHTPWYPGVPDNFLGVPENCGDYIFFNGRGGVNDAPCKNNPYPALCQYPSPPAQYCVERN